jgi:predicted transposase YdaD
MSQSEYDVYKESLLAYWESKGALETARLEGRIEGRLEGEQIGLQKGEQIGLQKGEQIGLQKGEQIGLQKGEQIGLQKGEQKKALEIAKNAIQLGLSNEEISKLTGLSVDEVSKLRSEK